jgi:hypothetical protein
MSTDGESFRRNVELPLRGVHQNEDRDTDAVLSPNKLPTSKSSSRSLEERTLPVGYIFEEGVGRS